MERVLIHMKIILNLSLLLVLGGGNVFGQGARPDELGASDLGMGEAGVAWYTRWDDAKAEAKRSGRPMFFMAAATQCGDIPGVF